MAIILHTLNKSEITQNKSKQGHFFDKKKQYV